MVVVHSGWSVIVPVKRLDEAKSRFTDSYDDPALLAQAFLEDVLDIVAMVPRVRRTIVTTSDSRAAAIAIEHGAMIVDDSDSPGINAAAAQASHQRAAHTAVAVLVSDLPWLTAPALDTALSLGEEHETSFIADHDGLGTTLWMSASTSGQSSHFGRGSRDAHARSGAVDLIAVHPHRAAELDPVRRDADTANALIHGDSVPPCSHTAELLRHRPLAAQRSV